ncbi:MAG: acetyl-CoA C-acetyltransferase, partial [Psychrobacter sp.]|nr:acetyl-CoA C-acetyltransferase [Psychrobacter sp.]
MSNKKDSPVIATTVTKAGESLTDELVLDNTDADSDSKAEATTNEAHFDSIAALKEATHIVDHAVKEDDAKSDNENTKSTDTTTHQSTLGAANLQASNKSNTENNDTNRNAEQNNAQKSTTESSDTQKNDTQKDTTQVAQANKDDSEATKTETKTTVQPVNTSANKTEDKDSSKATGTSDTKSASKAEDKPVERATSAAATTQSPAAKSTAKSSQSTANNGPIRVAILGGNRIPFARSNGPYANASNTDMLSAALNGLVERFDLQGERVGEVVAGAVLKLSRDLNLTRESALNTALDPQTPAYDVSQACGTGLQATFAAANKIALGVIDSAITGGVDTTSDAPIAVGDGLRKALIKLGAAKDNKQRFKALLSINPKDLIDAPQNGEPRTGLSMGDHQAITALEWNISREDQDELAFNSHKNLARAYDEGFFDDLITPFKGLTRDNNLRPDTTIDKLAKLKPVFGKKNANPTMTAANSTPLTDGASCVLLANDEWAEAHGLKPLAYIVHQETAAIDFIGKTGEKEGLLMAPAYAVPRMLERAGLSLQDFDFYEIHEAFASQVLSTLAAWEDE